MTLVTVLALLIESGKALFRAKHDGKNEFQAIMLTPGTYFDHSVRKNNSSTRI